MNLSDIKPQVPPEILAITGAWWWAHWREGYRYPLRYTVSTNALEYSVQDGARWNTFTLTLQREWAREPGADTPHPEILEVLP